MISSEAVIPPPAPAIMVEEGVCWVMFAYDVGAGIDLEAADRQLTEPRGRDELQHQRRAPRYLQFQPAPLRIELEVERISLAAGRKATGSLAEAPAEGGGSPGPVTDSKVTCTLFDFGAISVAYRVRLRCPLEGLLDVAEALYENEALLADSRRIVESLLRRLGGAIRFASIAAAVEDYVVYEVRRWECAAPIAEAVASHAQTIGGVLRAERGPMSAQELAEAMSCRIAFSPADAVVIDWNAALVFDARAEDALAVLEYANVELLELRYLDDRLDGILEQASRAVQGPRWGQLLPGLGAEQRRRIANLQMDAALLFEGINNAIKLLGDQYLARLYRLTAHRLHLQDWEASILRKLQTVDGIYQKLTDAASTRRMEVLEWIIIILIAVSIVLPFLGVGK
ncbi:MAG: hypothetical protein AB7K52_02895 [Phycisphaerales bacterium]